MSSVIGSNSRTVMAKEMATGQARHNNTMRSQFSAGINFSSAASVIKQYVVIEVISDPQFLSEGSVEVIQKMQSLYREGKSINISAESLSLLPRNTLIAQPINSEDAGISGERIILLPFFPSHLALPCKPGEHVWALHPLNESSGGIEVAYWMCRVTPFVSMVDDVNHTHHPRISNIPNEFSSIEASKESNKKNPEYRVAGTFKNEDGTTETSSDGRHVITDDDKFYEKLLTESDSANLMQYEPVPRFKKRPGDLALEGSNNTLIVLGTDRQGPYSDVTVTNDKIKKQSIPKTDVLGTAGSIDIVAGRGQTERTGGKKIFSKKIDGENFFEEIDKQNPLLGEGDPDFITDKSRIFVSQRTKIDARANIENFNKKFGINENSDGGGSAAILTKSDKLRMVARKDAQILVEDKDGKPITTVIATSGGSILINSKSTTIKIDSAGNITLNAAGDIVLNPSETGVIKLGGEDANKAILCQDQGVTGAGGQVIAPPVVDTMGGTMGAPGFGVFASKVLIK